MKIVKTASGKKTIKMSRKEWTAIGKKAGWMKKFQETEGNFDTVILPHELIQYAIQHNLITPDQATSPSLIDASKSAANFINNSYSNDIPFGKERYDAAVQEMVKRAHLR